jgi:hypothetical protein
MSTPNSVLAYLEDTRQLAREHKDMIVNACAVSKSTVAISQFL